MKKPKKPQTPRCRSQTRSNYSVLAQGFRRAHEQVALGEGAKRHGQGAPFDQQPTQTISRLVGTNRGMLYPAVKKCQESTRLPREAAVFELLGAINYLAGAGIYLESERCRNAGR
jgi:hypothetical protein